MSTSFARRAGVLGAVALLAAIVTGVAPAGAAVANPAATTTLTVKTTVTNNGHGSLTPDSFVFHVIRASDGADVLDGIFSHTGTTKITLPIGTYAITEDPIEPYTEHVSGCAHVVLTGPKTCSVSNVWTFAKIRVSSVIANAGGGFAKPSYFHYHVIDANTNATVKSGTLDDSGTTTIKLPDGSYTVTEDVAYGYTEDYSSCADLTIDLADPATCVVANTFDPHSTTTASNTSTTRPGDTQVKIHGSATTPASCQMTLQPALQDPSTSLISITLSGDAFPQPHKGEPITMSNVKLSVTTPASLIQTGVDLGIINSGDVIPEKGTLVIGGIGTQQSSQTYKFNSSETINVVGGKAQPLTSIATLPDTTWNPSNATDPVFFSVSSLKLVSTITSAQLGGAVTSTFTCPTPNSASFLALSAQGGPIPTTTEGSGGGSGGGTGGGSGSGTGGGSGGVGTGANGSGILPVTGTSIWLWLAPAVVCIYLGLLAIGSTARKRRRTLN